MSSSLRRLSFLYSGVIFVLKELYVIALIILLCNTFNWFKVVMPTPPQIVDDYKQNWSKVILMHYHLDTDVFDKKSNTAGKFIFMVGYVVRLGKLIIYENPKIRDARCSRFS